MKIAWEIVYHLSTAAARHTDWEQPDAPAMTCHDRGKVFSITARTWHLHFVFLFSFFSFVSLVPLLFSSSSCVTPQQGKFEFMHVRHLAVQTLLGPPLPNIWRTHFNIWWILQRRTDLLCRCDAAGLHAQPAKNTVQSLRRHSANINTSLYILIPHVNPFPAAVLVADSCCISSPLCVCCWLIRLHFPQFSSNHSAFSSLSLYLPLLFFSSLCHSLVMTFSFRPRLLLVPEKKERNLALHPVLFWHLSHSPALLQNSRLAVSLLRRMLNN